jgi:hypothetical protein
MGKCIAQSYKYDLLDYPSPQTRVVYSHPGPFIPSRRLYPINTRPKDVSTLCGCSAFIQLSDQRNHTYSDGTGIHSPGTHKQAERPFIPAHTTCSHRPTSITILCAREIRGPTQRTKARTGAAVLASHAICSLPTFHPTGPTDKQLVLRSCIFCLEESSTLSFEFIYTGSYSCLYAAFTTTPIHSDWPCV